MDAGANVMSTDAMSPEVEARALGLLRQRSGWPTCKKGCGFVTQDPQALVAHEASW